MVCLKEAYDLSPQLIQGELHWLYAPGRSLSTLKVRDGKLKTDDPKALALIRDRNVSIDVDLDRHDAFVVVGLGLSPRICAEIYRYARPFRHSTSDFELVSEACFRSILGRAISSTTAFSICKMLREHSKKPIYIVPQPAPLEVLETWTMPQKPRGREPRAKIWARFQRYADLLEVYRPFIDEEAGPFAMELFEKALETSSHRWGVNPIAQPKDTLHKALTKSCYVRDKGSRALDVVHTNSDFGAKILQQLSDALSLRSS